MKKYILLGLIFIFGLSGCSMFTKSPDLSLNMNVSSQSNSGKTLTVLVVPMSKASFMKTSYKEALSYVGKNQTYFISLTPEKLSSGEINVKTPVKKGESVALFVFFTSMKPDSQWKQFIPDAFGNEYNFIINKYTLKNFKEVS